MGALDELIGRMEGEGTLESEGGFSLDRDKAREKMRQFQLDDPHRYVLLLAQAAGAKGAQTLVFDIDTDDMRLRFDGAPFNRVDLDELYASLFANRHDGAMLARQELALALNAAMALQPRYITLESGDGARGVRLHMRPGQDDRIEEAEGIEAGTRIHVKDRFRPGLFVKFWRDVAGTAPEERLIKSHCAWSTRTVMLDGKRVSRGLELEGLAQASVEIEGVQVLGAFERLGQAARVEILSRGVWVCAHELPEFPQGFRAIADAVRLRKDVSQSDVVRDAAYDELLAQVALACDAALTRLASEAKGLLEGVPFDVEAADETAEEAPAQPVGGTPAPEPTVPSSVPPWMPRMLRGELAARSDEDRDGPAPTVVARLGELRLFTTIMGEPVSAAMLRKRNERVTFTSTMVPYFDEKAHRDVVYAPDLPTRSALRKIFGKRLIDRTRVLQRETEREANRRRWRARAASPTLGVGVYHAREPITGDRIVGEIGLRAVGGEKPQIRLVHDGCLLVEIEIDAALAGLTAAIEAPFTPNASFDGVQRDGALNRAALAIVEALHRMMLGLAQRAHAHEVAPALRDALAQYIVGMRGDLVPTILRGLGLKSRGTAALLQDGEAAARSPELGLGEEVPHVLARVPLLDTIDERRVSLAEVHGWLATREDIPYVSCSRPPFPDPPHPVLRVDAIQLSLLEAVFGGKRLFKFGPRYQIWLNERAFRETPLAPRQLERDVAHGPHAMLVDGAHVIVGLAWPTEGSRGAWPVKADGHTIVLKFQRRLGDLRSPLPMPGVHALVDDDTVETNMTFSGVANEAAREHVEAKVGAALAALVRQKLPATGAVPPADHGVIAWAAAAVFPDARWCQVFRRVGAQVYGELLEIRGQYLAGDADRSLGRLCDEQAEITAPGLLARLDPRRRRARPAPDSIFRLAMAELFGHLAAVPLFVAVDGRLRSLADLFAEVREHGSVLRVTGGARDVMPTGDRPVVRLDPAEELVFARFFMEKEIEDGAPWVADVRRRAAFEARPKLPSIELPADAVLVKVPVKHEDLRGEVGLPVVAPDDARPEVTACRDQRPLGVYDVGASHPYLGIVDSETLGGDHVGEGLATADLERLRAICNGALRPLRGALAEAWPSLQGQRREAATAWVLRLLEQGARGLDRRPPKRPGLRALTEVPVFPILGRAAMSLRELHVEIERRDGALSCLFTAHPPEPLPDRIVVDARITAVRDAIVSIVPGNLDVVEEVAAEAERRQRLQRAPELPRVPSDALASVAVDETGLSGHLWIPASTELGPVWLGVKGRGLGQVDMSRGVACTGALEGDWIEVSDELDRATLPKRHRIAVRVAAVGLATQLAESFEWLERAQRTEGIDAVTADRLRLMELALVQILRRLPEMEVSTRGLRDLSRKLERLPLLRLTTGHRLTPEVARRERPIELSHLQLWVHEPDDVETVSSDASDVRAQDPAREPSPSPSRERPPAPEPAVAAAPVAPPPPPTPVQLLLEAVRAELRAVRSHNLDLLSDAHLDLLDVRPLGDHGEMSTGSLVVSSDGVHLDAEHPVVKAALRTQGPDPIAVSFFASAIYSVLNARLGEITDHDEANFHRLHAERIAGRRG